MRPKFCHTCLFFCIACCLFVSFISTVYNVMVVSISYNTRFWSVVESFTAVEQQSLLKFVTGGSRPPLMGFKYLNPRFTIRLVSNVHAHSGRMSLSSRFKVCYWAK